MSSHYLFSNTFNSLPQHLHLAKESIQLPENQDLARKSKCCQKIKRWQKRENLILNLLSVLFLSGKGKSLSKYYEHSLKNSEKCLSAEQTKNPEQYFPFYVHRKQILDFIIFVWKRRQHLIFFISIVFEI